MKNDELIAEFIGMMLGDGNFGIYLSKAGNKIKKQHRIKITLDSRNKQYVNYTENMFKKVLNVEPRVYYKNGENYKRKENAVDIATFRKDSFFYLLNDIGLITSPKWGRMKIPEGYNKGKLGLFVLKGLFDTDGCVTIYKNNGIVYPRIEIRLSPCPAQEQINHILDEFEFNYKVQNLERGKTKIRLSGKKELEKWFKLVGSASSVNIDRAKQFMRR